MRVKVTVIVGVSVRFRVSSHLQPWHMTSAPANFGQKIAKIQPQISMKTGSELTKKCKTASFSQKSTKMTAYFNENGVKFGQKMQNCESWPNTNKIHGRFQ